MLGNFACFFVVSADLFSKLMFSKNHFWECQTVWIKIRTNIMSVLILTQTVCKGYPQMTKVTASKESVKVYSIFNSLSTSKINVFVNYICLSRLLHIFANITDCKFRGKQFGPRSDCSCSSRLFDQEASNTFQQTTKADDFCCEWCFEG